jgi:hypothetical protein
MTNHRLQTSFRAFLEAPHATEKCATCNRVLRFFW